MLKLGAVLDVLAIIFLFMMFIIRVTSGVDVAFSIVYIIFIAVLAAMLVFLIKRIRKNK